MRKFVKYASITIIVLVAVTYGLLSILFRPSKDEVARVPAPGRSYEAVLVEINGGATASFLYEVYVVHRGASTWASSPVASLYGATRNDHAYGANLRWSTPEKLSIEYLRTRYHDLTTKKMTLDGKELRVALQDGVNDPAAPAGGMLFNLKARQ